MSVIIVLRIVHIAFGVFWVGAVLFLNLVLGPSLQAIGPAGVPVLQELNRRKYFDILLGSGLLTILAGLELVRRDSAGFDPSWFRTRFGMGISTGMVAAVIAFLIGWLVVKPTVLRMTHLGAQLASAAPEDRIALAGSMTATQATLKVWGIAGTLFLLIAMVAMAIARYM